MQATKDLPGSICNVARFLPEAALNYPELCAVRAPKSSFLGGPPAYLEKSFIELERESNAVGYYLASIGIVRNTKVLLMVRPGLNLINITFALFKLGAIPIIIDPGMGLRNFLSCVEQIQPEALVGIPVAILLSKAYPNTFSSVKIRVNIKQAAFGNAPARFQQRELAQAQTQSDDLAAILFTSGSTGPPKGVTYQHGNFEAQVALIRSQYKIQPGEVDLPMLPIFALFNPAMAMTTVIPQMNPSKPAKVNPARIVRAIQENRVTNSFGSPALWTRIGRYCTTHKILLPSIRRILIAGAPATPTLLRMLEPIFPNGTIHTPYGATESLPVSTISSKTVLHDTCHQTEQGKGTCVGNLFPKIEVGIIQITDQVISDWSPSLSVKSGDIGEIVVKGPTVTSTYYGMPAATELAKIPAGDGFWHRMGDLGYFDASGRLWFCGRKAERVVCADGTVLYTDCCEGILNQHPDVLRSALIGLGQWGQHIPAIVIEPEKNCRLSRSQLIESVKAFAKNFPLLKPIQTFLIHHTFPVDVRHNAKIHRLSLKKIFEYKMRNQL